MADLAHAKENDTDLHGDPDATHWAERFVHHVQVNPAIATSEGAMLAWFAGAIETGRMVRGDWIRESIATRIEALAANYPEGVFPENGVSRDSISGTAMRHAYRNAARFIREDWSDD